MFEIELTICIKMDLMLTNLQRLICHKIQPIYQHIKFIFSNTFIYFYFLFSFLYLWWVCSALLVDCDWPEDHNDGAVMPFQKKVLTKEKYPKWRNVLPPWRHYLVLFIYGNQTFSIWFGLVGFMAYQPL